MHTPIQSRETKKQTQRAAPPVSKLIASLALGGLCAATVLFYPPVQAQGKTKISVDLPPSADLHYRIKAKQSGIPVNGSAVVQWHVGAKDGVKNYTVHSETRASIFGKIVDSTSQGRVDESGLIPEQFTEKRLGKDATITTFDRDKKSISFSASDTHYDIKGGEQDRASATWQLVAIARTAGDNFKTGSEWKMQVAYVRDADPWVFKVVGHESIITAMGTLDTVHLVKAPPADSKDQQLDIWLAPSVEWYPVRLRFNDADGSFVDQVIDHVKK